MYSILPLPDQLFTAFPNLTHLTLSTQSIFGLANFAYMFIFMYGGRTTKSAFRLYLSNDICTEPCVEREFRTGSFSEVLERHFYLLSNQYNSFCPNVTELDVPSPLFSAKSEMVQRHIVIYAGRAIVLLNLLKDNLCISHCLITI